MEHAERTVTPEGGGDFRIEVPEGDYVGGNGVIEPAARETRVAADVAGRIAAIVVAEGDQVEAGALLVELDHSVEDAALAAAQADVDASQAELLRTTRGSRREDIRASVADAEAARARAELSSGVLERFEAVVASGGVTVDELDRARKQAEADRAAADQADARRDATVRGSRREDVQAAQARLAAAKARRDQAEAARAERFVRSPIAAEILQSKFRPGEYYQPGGADPLMIVGDTRTLRVRMDVDERDVGRVRTGANAIVRAPSFEGTDFAGKVVEIGKRMGRKNVSTDNPTERTDMKILETVIELQAPDGLVVGQRVMVYVAASGGE